MRFMSFSFILLFSLSLAQISCAKRETVHPTQIRVVNQIDNNVCAQIGTVSGSAFPGQSRRGGTEQALDEALYQAEALNATHILIETRRHSTAEGTHVKGLAYRC